MKHQWHEEALPVILTLKEQLSAKTVNIETDLELYLVFQKHICSVRKEYGDKRAFYQIWQETPAAFRKKWIGTEFWQIWLCQAAASVLQKKDPLTREGKKVFEFLMEWFFRKPVQVALPSFPVRLPDKNLYTAASSGDLAKIIFLYDSAVTPGQKMKNICHLLLNIKDYQTLMQLQDIYGCLDQFDMELLLPHLYFPVQTTAGKEKFDYYCFRRNSGDENFSWEKLLRIGCLHTGIRPALKAGMNPDAPMFSHEKYTFSLRQLMYFLDECQEEFDKMYNLEHFKKLLTASKVFTTWEKGRQKQSPENTEENK
jgi:hypothetical protein